MLTVEYPSAAQSSTSSNLLILKRQKGLYLAEVSFFKAQLDFFCVALSGIPEIQCLQELDTINKRWQNKTAGALGLPNYTPRVHSLPFLKVTLRNHSFYSEPKCSYFFSNWPGYSTSDFSLSVSEFQTVILSKYQCYSIYSVNIIVRIYSGHNLHFIPCLNIEVSDYCQPT